MKSPTAALGWEFWRRYRKSIIFAVGVFLAFAFIYPTLCRWAGFDPRAEDPMMALTNFPNKVSSDEHAVVRVIHILYLFLLCAGPKFIFGLSLALVVRMFTFTDLELQTNQVLRFPARVFALPISTPFLFWRLALGGMAAVFLLYTGWTQLVPIPRIVIETGIPHNVAEWMTLLVMTQGVVWALDGWPFVRQWTLLVMPFCILFDKFNVFTRAPALPIGLALGWVGLHQMRLGQWQGLRWGAQAGGALRGPRRFKSPAQAQFWYEWNFARVWFLVALGGALVCAAGCWGAHIFYGWPSSKGDVMGVLIALCGLILLTHFAGGASMPKTNQAFFMVRPLTTGQMAVAQMRAATLGAALSGVAVLAALGAVWVLGDFTGLVPTLLKPSGAIASFCALIFVTWRMAVINRCFVVAGSRWLSSVPAILVYVLCVLGVTLSWMSNNDARWRLFLACLPALLAGLVAAKFLLAAVSFNVSLRRRFFERSTVMKYLAVWAILVVVVLWAALVMFQPGAPALFSLVLGVVLLVPLARIGLYPIALARYRQTTP